MDRARRSMSKNEFMELLDRAEVSLMSADSLEVRAGLHRSALVGLAALAVVAATVLGSLTSIAASVVVMVLALTLGTCALYFRAVVVPLTRQRQTELYLLEDAVSLLRSGVDVIDWEHDNDGISVESVRMRLARFPAGPSRHRGT